MKKSNRILFLCQFFYPEKVSSAVLPFELAQALVEKGYSVKSLNGYPKEYTDYTVTNRKEHVDGVLINRIRYVQLKRTGFIGRIINYFSFCIAVLLHFNQFKDIDYCITYSNPPLLPFIPALFKKIFSFEMIYVVYDVYPDVAINFNAIRKGSLIEKVMNFVNSYVFKRCKNIIVLSSEMKEYFITHKEVEEEKLCVIPNWYHRPLDYVPLERHKRLRVLYGGNMGILQDMETLMQAMLMLKNDPRVEFIFAGHGIKHEIIKECIEKNSVANAIIYDFLPKEEYDKLADDADVAVVTLEKNVKGLGSPSKIYSYYASGKPVIAVVPDGIDIVKDISEYHNGFTVKNGDVDSLVKVLKEMMSYSNDRLNEFGKNSFNLYKEKYTLEVNLEKYIRLLGEI